MSAQTIVEETSRFEQLLADLKIPSGDPTGVSQQLGYAVAQAGFKASTGTIVAAEHQSRGELGGVQQPRGGLFSTWPYWAFELAKAALLSQQCSAAEALEAVTRSGGGEGRGHSGRIA
jgi:hypothetical protein